MARLTRADLLGGWQLERWEILHEDGGRRTLPFGEGAKGLLLYTLDGHMSANIMAAGRVPLSTTNPRSAPATERAAAFDGYFSYAGRYRVAGSEVRHELTVALNPAMTGTLQVREARLLGRRLELAADEALPDGHHRRHVLRWKRVPRRRP